MSPRDPLKVIGRYADPDTWVDAVFASPIQNPICISQVQTHNGGRFCKTRQMPGIQGDRSTGCVPRCVLCPDYASVGSPELTHRPQCADGVDCGRLEGMEGSALGMVCGATDPTRGFQITLEEDIGLAIGPAALLEDHRSHPQEKYGWIAMPAGAGGTLGTLRYEAIVSSDPGVTHEPFTVAFRAAFATEPAVFGSAMTLNGGDTIALRRTATTAGSVEIFVEEESCSDEEVAHTAEGVGMLVIENLHAVDSQTQATLPATLGALTPPM